jgi:hypothetical protein
MRRSHCLLSTERMRICRAALAADKRALAALVGHAQREGECRAVKALAVLTACTQVWFCFLQHSHVQEVLCAGLQTWQPPPAGGRKGRRAPVSRSPTPLRTFRPPILLPPQRQINRPPAASGRHRRHPPLR